MKKIDWAVVYFVVGNVGILAITVGIHWKY